MCACVSRVQGVSLQPRAAPSSSNEADAAELGPVGHNTTSKNSLPLEMGGLSCRCQMSCTVGVQQRCRLTEAVRPVTWVDPSFAVRPGPTGCNMGTALRCGGQSAETERVERHQRVREVGLQLKATACLAASRRSQVTSQAAGRLARLVSSACKQAHARLFWNGASNGARARLPTDTTAT